MDPGQFRAHVPCLRVFSFFSLLILMELVFSRMRDGLAEAKCSQRDAEGRAFCSIELRGLGGVSKLAELSGARDVSDKGWSLSKVQLMANGLGLNTCKTRIQANTLARHHADGQRHRLQAKQSRRHWPQGHHTTKSGTLAWLS